MTKKKLYQIQTELKKIAQSISRLVNDNPVVVGWISILLTIFGLQNMWLAVPNIILAFLQIYGAKRDSIYEYLKDVLPANKTEDQQLRYVGRLLVELNEEKLIDRIGLKWILTDNNRSV